MPCRDGRHDRAVDPVRGVRDGGSRGRGRRRPPLVARHSGLGEVGAALESAIGRPGLLTFDPGPGAVARLARRSIASWSSPGERDELRRGVSAFVGREWTWDRTAAGLLAAANAG